MGFNVAGITALIDDMYLAIIAIAGLIGVINFVRGTILIKYAAQLGGMNSMGTRSFYSEASIHIFAGIIMIYFASYISLVGEDLFQAQFEWNNEAEAASGLYGFGSFVLKLIKLFGVLLMFKGVLALTDKEGGSIKKFFLSTFFGLLAMYIEAVSKEFSLYTGFNPLALFIPGTSVMTL